MHTPPARSRMLSLKVSAEMGASIVIAIPARCVGHEKRVLVHATSAHEPRRVVVSSLELEKHHNFTVLTQMVQREDFH